MIAQNGDESVHNGNSDGQEWDWLVPQLKCAKSVFNIAIGKF